LWSLLMFEAFLRNLDGAVKPAPESVAPALA
jgi:hypothetical protein